MSIKNQEDIKGDLRDLPASLETFNCEGTIFQQELEPFEYDFKIYRLTQENKELKIKIEEEREIHEDAMKVTDRFYRQNPPQEDLSLQNILEEISNDYLSLNRENEQLRKEKRKLEDRLKSLSKLMEVELGEKKQLEAKIEVLSLEKNSKPK